MDDAGEMSSWFIFVALGVKTYFGWLYFSYSCIIFATSKNI